jgi:DNA repair protein RadC
VFGTSKPSQQDHQLSRLPVQALGPPGAKVQDHIIAAGKQAFSFAVEGIMLFFYMGIDSLTLGEFLQFF